jgi:hypothetical protein
MKTLISYPALFGHSLLSGLLLVTATMAHGEQVNDTAWKEHALQKSTHRDGQAPAARIYSPVVPTVPMAPSSVNMRVAPDHMRVAPANLYVTPGNLRVAPATVQAAPGNLRSKPAVAQSAYQQPIYQQPIYQQPRIVQPTYQQSAVRQVAWQEPAYIQPSRYEHRHHHHNVRYYNLPQYWVPAHTIWRAGAWINVPAFYADAFVPPMPDAFFETGPDYEAPGYVWVRGHWTWGGFSWIWRAGQWLVVAD